MKHFLAPILLALTFSVMFSSTSFAGWTKVRETVEGNTYYVDFERIRKHGGYVYYWLLSDYLKPIEGYLSSKTYNQGDCNLFGYKNLSFSSHKGPMSGGISESKTNPDKWVYPSPDSTSETILKSVCAYAK